ISNSSSNTGNSLARLTIVARSAARNASRSASPVTSDALKASSVSASETRTPFSRSRFANSTSFSCMMRWCPALFYQTRDCTVILRRAQDHRSRCSRSVQKILVAAGFGAAPRAHATHIILQLFLRFANVALVLDDRVERLGQEFLVEAVDVEQRQRLDPIERLADAGRLFQIELAQRLHDGDDFLGELDRCLGG